MASASGQSAKPIFTPPDSPTSPSASFYDLSDDDERDYNTITHTSSGRGVKLLYSKSKVYVHPSPSAKDNIAGFIALIQQKPPAVSGTVSPAVSNSQQSKIPASSLLLAWLPEASLGDAYDTYVKVDLVDGASPPRQSYLVPTPPTTSFHTHGSQHGHHPHSVGYAFAIPVSQVYSLLVRPPSLGWWWGSLVINTRSGDSFPALFFHDSECASTIAQSKKRARENFDPFGEAGGLFWGGDEVLRWLKQYTRVEQSKLEKSVYLIDPSGEDTKSFIEQPTIVGNPSAITGGGSSSAVPEMRAGPSSGVAQMDPITKALKEARWTFLEKLSAVTQFTRRTAQNVLDSPNVPPQVRRLLKNPDVQSIQDEFDSARLYLARWAMGIAEQSERDRLKTRNETMYSPVDLMEMEESAVGEFEILEIEMVNLKLDSPTRKSVSVDEWNGWWDSAPNGDGRLQITVEEVKERIFHGGLETEVRKHAWLYLLGVYKWDSTKDERKAVENSRRDEYIRLKGKWWDDYDRKINDDYWRDQRNRIEKDVHRTDRTIALFAGEDIPHPDPDSPFAESGTNVHLEQLKDMLLTYNELNPSLGYVQGMSDLLSPLYAVLQDDALAFWAFAGFMDRMQPNFLRDQSGMRDQLVTLEQLVKCMDPKLWSHLQDVDSTNFFFFFRMLLVWYKREFGWDDILCLWEVLFTDYLSGGFHLFIALAILERHRSVIMEHLKGFDEVLKYINELSNTIDLPSTRVRAEALFYRYKRVVEAQDRKGSFPSPATAPRKRLSSQNFATAGDPSLAPSSSSPTPELETAHSLSEGISNASLGPVQSMRSASSPQSRVAERGKSIGGPTHSNAATNEPGAPGTEITEELRRLLSNKPIQWGSGVGAPPRHTASPGRASAGPNKAGPSAVRGKSPQRNDS